MTIESYDELAGMARAGAAVAAARDAMLAAVAPGVSTAELDAIGRGVLRQHGARSAPRLSYGFPGWTCISVNDALAHGVPSQRVVLRRGDLVNVDVSAELDGFWADTGATTGVGKLSTRRAGLVSVTRQAQRAAMRAARAGARLNVIGWTVEQFARRHRFRVIRSLGGHGIGRELHESPHVSNWFDARDTTRLHEGLVLTVEPFLTFSASDVVEDSDGWTLRTADGSLGAQFEHTFVVTNGEPLVLTEGESAT